MSLSFAADLSQWTSFFEGAEQRLANPGPALEKVGDLMVTETRGNIADGGGAAEWPPLKASTLAARAKSHPGAGTAPLVVTRELFNSIEKDVHSAESYVDTGSSLPYARTQFFGRGNIPARSAFVYRPAIFERVGGVFVNFILTGRGA